MNTRRAAPNQKMYQKEYIHEKVVKIPELSEITPIQIKGSSPPPKFCWKDPTRPGRIVEFILLENTRNCNIFAVSLKTPPPQIKQYQILYYWKNQSERQQVINELNDFGANSRWVDTHVQSRGDYAQWFRNWIRLALANLTDHKNKPLDLDETF
jgi:hypothetical protein